MSKSKEGSSPKNEQHLSKANIKFLAKKKIEEIQNPVELICRAKVFELMAEAMRKSAANALLASDFIEEDWNGITVKKRAGRRTKSYSDKELSKMEDSLSKLAAKIKARKAYLDQLKEYTIKEGNETIAVLVP